jgi:hypothetical protein
MMKVAIKNRIYLYTFKCMCRNDKNYVIRAIKRYKSRRNGLDVKIFLTAA